MRTYSEFKTEELVKLNEKLAEVTKERDEWKHQTAEALASAGRQYEDLTAKLERSKAEVKRLQENIEKWFRPENEKLRAEVERLRDHHRTRHTECPMWLTLEAK
jgi:predicted nuclease with TOPRIM domain